MASRISVYYDSYSNNLRILVNNEQLSSYSSLIQYMNEPLYKWAPYIFDKFYRAIEDNYILEFTGRPEEHEIIKYFAEKDSHCEAVFLREFPVSISLQDRMKEMNKYIKANDSILYRKHQMNMRCYVPISLRDIGEDLKGLSVNNRFCKTNVTVDFLNRLTAIKHPKGEVGIAIARDVQQMQEMASLIDSSTYFTIIYMGRRDRFVGFLDGCYIFESNAEQIFNTLFRVLLLFPLHEVFYKTCTLMEDLNSNVMIQKRLRGLRSTQPILMFTFPGALEEATSKEIQIKSSPAQDKLPDLIYQYEPEGIVEIRGQRIRALHKGECKISVFRKGELLPIHTENVRVYRRNRITSLHLNVDEAQIAVSEHIQLNRSYLPEDADNAAEIRWISENPEIVKVNQKGLVVGVKPGVARVRCMAEKVSVTCTIDVRPRLREIILPEELQEGELTLKLGDIYPLDVKIIPGNAIDNRLIYYCENTMVANVVRGCIEAVGIGTTYLKIQNNSRRITQMLTITVTKNGKKKKKGFFF